MNQADLDYLSRLFHKISSKPTELYVMTRLWHRLDDLEIQMIPQQYVGLPENQYAISDIFFPQANIFVEINESQHYASELRIKMDQYRNDAIQHQTGIEVVTIDCRPSLQEIHLQIDQIVEVIKRKVAASRQAGTFKRWRPNEARNPQYWKAKKIIRVEDDVIMSNIEAICQLFDANFNKTKRGFLRKGAITLPTNSGYSIWWPSAISRSGWKNECLEDGTIITESHESPEKNRVHFHSTLKWPHKRIIFYHQKDVLGFQGYYFMGVYELDINRSNEHEGLFWNRVSTFIPL